jgi:hypothetical protein
MPWTIIVGSNDADQLELLTLAAEAIRAAIKLPGLHRLFTVMSVDDVKRLRVKGDPATQLLIVTASLPEGHLGGDLRAQSGYNLIKSLQAEPNPPACILVSERIDHYRAAQLMRRCEWLPVDERTNYFDLCLNLAAKLRVLSIEPNPAVVPGTEKADLAPPVETASSSLPAESAVGKVSAPSLEVTEIQPLTQYALIDVVLPNQAKYATVQLDVCRPKDPIKGSAVPLNLRQSEVDAIVKESHQLRKRVSEALCNVDEWQKYHRLWKAEYRSLGERIFKLLWSDDFARYYFTAKAAVPPPNVRLRFNLERTLLDGLWEAIFDKGENEFVMLGSTVARRAIQKFDKFAAPQMDSDGVLNVLFIRSDVADNSIPEGPDDLLWQEYWDSLNASLPRLTHLEDEMRVLRKLQKKSEQANEARHTSKVRKIQVDIVRGNLASKHPYSLADLVERRLMRESGRYDVVHFAGHALFAPSKDSKKTNEANGRGYLVFSGRPRPRAVPIAEIAGWLNETGVQLVYLSCCRSSAARAAVEFAKNNIPITIGFTWDLDDNKAVEFTRLFYEELLTEAGLKVCPAFREARRKLHNKFDSGDPIWASPVLVAQPLDWKQVEGVIQPPPRRDLIANTRRRLPAAALNSNPASCGIGACGSAQATQT